MRTHLSRRRLLSILGFLPLCAPVSALAQPPKQDAPTPGNQVDPKAPATYRSREEVNGRTLYDWSKDLRDKDPSIRERAIAALKAFGPDARVYASDVIKAMRDKDVSLRVNAAITLGIIGIENTYLEEGVKELSLMLDDQQGIVRFQAINALARLGFQANVQPSLVPKLVSATDSQSSWEIRQAALHALAELGWMSMDKGFDVRAFAAAARGTHDPCMEVRYQAVLTLIKFGQPRSMTERTKIVLRLNELITDKQPKKVSLWARVAVMRIEDNVTSAHLAAIGKLLSDPSLEIRRNAAHALGTVGSQAFSTVPYLKDALNDKHADVVITSCWALGKIGPKAEKAIPALEQLTQHSDELVRQAAREAIDAINAKFQKLSAVEEASPTKQKPVAR
jgi:HEAT repeat protein